MRFAVPLAGSEQSRRRGAIRDRAQEFHTLSQYGKSVSTLTESPVVSPAAWRNLTQAVDYRTFLNGQYAPRPRDFTPATGDEDYRSSINILPDQSAQVGAHRAVSVGFAGGHVPQEQSARLEELSDPRSHITVLHLNSKTYTL
jgi:hypothetical protein